MIHANETHMQVLHEQGRKATQNSYFWVFLNAKTDERQICVYHYDPTRSSKVVNSFLAGWKGYLTTDGHQAYFSSNPDIINTACLAHIRRKFFAIIERSGKQKATGEYESLAQGAFDLIQDIYGTDKTLDGLDPPTKYEM